MKTISIDGIIGWDITTNGIKEQLPQNENVTIELNSPGGSVVEGFAIYNILQKWKRDNPGFQLITEIIGIAASMGSIIALAGDVIKVYSTSIYMIHNPYTLAMGDAEEMQKVVDRLKKLELMSAKIYNAKTKQEIEEILSLMKDESFFYGQEIIDSGFADELIVTESEETKENSVLLAKMMIEDAKDKFSTKERAQDLEKAVALFEINKKENIPENQGKNILEEAKMPLQEILAKYPDVKAELDGLLDSAKAEGEKNERDRVVELLGFVTMSANMKKAISEGMNAGDYAKAELLTQKENKPKDQTFGKFENSNSGLEEDKTEEEIEMKKVDEILDGYFGKKEGGK